MYHPTVRRMAESESPAMCARQFQHGVTGSPVAEHLPVLVDPILIAVFIDVDSEYFADAIRTAPNWHRGDNMTSIQ